MPYCYLFLSLLVASVFLSTPLDSNSAKECKTVTRAAIEEQFGKPVKCLKDSKDVECFGNQLQPMRVQFDSSDGVTNIEMTTLCSGLESLIKVLNVIVPTKARGKYFQELQRSPSGSCRRIYEEEYQCVRIMYSQELCMGCAPASIKAIWK
jgi:hypothetical protein